MAKGHTNYCGLVHRPHVLLPYGLNWCEIFVVYTEFTNVATGRGYTNVTVAFV